MKTPRPRSSPGGHLTGPPALMELLFLEIHAFSDWTLRSRAMELIHY